MVGGGGGSGIQKRDQHSMGMGGVVVDDKVLKGNHRDEEGQSPSSNSNS